MDIKQEKDVKKINFKDIIEQCQLFIKGDLSQEGLENFCDKIYFKTYLPLEEKIISDFNIADIVVCTDAGLASTANRIFNNKKNRKFITTQSIKKLKNFLKDFAKIYFGD